jgi:ADP-ribose pyrophosphatase YjhB (NUDIX family)
MPAHICATAWVLSPDGEHAIFVRHKTLGWSTPGGHVEIGENTHDAARRELEEETGLTRFDTRLIGNGPAVVHTTDTNNPRDHRHWNVGWLMTADMDAPLSPVEGARWFACDRLPDGPPDIAATLPILRTLLARDTP